MFGFGELEERKALIATAVLGALAAVCALAAWSFWWVPNQQISDEKWLKQATAEELREESQWGMRWPVGNHHDACLYLERVGTRESVSIIAHALPWVDDSEPPRRLASCSLGHCEDALRALSSGASSTAGARSGGP